MDAALAERLASSGDPKGLAALTGRSSDGAVRRAVAEQFGAFLMQGLMQQSDGGAMPMAGGIGGATVSAMFAGEMGRVAMTGDKLGLADMLLRSMTAKEAAAGAAGAQAAPTTSPAPVHGPSYASPPNPAPAAATPPPSQAAPAHGFSLAPYWLGHGRRPIANPLYHPAPPTSPGTATAAKPPAAGMTPPPNPVPAISGFPLPPRPAIAAPPNASIVAPVTAAPAPPAAVTPPPQSSAAPLSEATSAAQRAAFINDLAPSLRQAATQLGVSPKILLAQAALETGWGRSVVGNNVFGVKAGASWSGSVVQAMTHEVENGRTVTRADAFRSYPDIASAVRDYVALILGSERYRGALGAGGDATAYAQALATGGYATDGRYAAKLAAIAASPALAAAAAMTPPETIAS